jgi:hypothetical protein
VAKLVYCSSVKLNIERSLSFCETAVNVMTPGLPSKTVYLAHFWADRRLIS